MSINYLRWPEEGSGGAAGVSSLNTLTGALTLAAGSGISLTPVGGTITIAATTSGSGTVTSVGLTTPGVLFTVAGSPVTTAGTLAMSLITQSANAIFAGPLTGSAATPTFRALSLVDLPAMSNNTIIGNVSGITEAPSELTATQATALLNTFTSSLQGLAPSSGGGTTNFLRADGTWAAPSIGTGTVTSIATNNGITGGTITNSGTIGLAAIINNSILGNVSGSSAVPVALTATQLTTLVNTFTSSLSGAAPSSGGGTTNFLRADGTWAAPSGGGINGFNYLEGNTSVYGGTNLTLFSTGTGNTLIGIGAGENLTSGGSNLLLGYRAGYTLTTGQDNTILSSGSTSLPATLVSAVLIGNATVNGDSSIAIGQDAIANISTGGDSVAIGSSAQTDGTGSVAIGNNATAEYANSMALGQGAIATGTNQIVLGNTSITSTLLNGAITLGTASTTPQHVLNTATATGSGTSTLGTANSPGGATPAGWIEITINGTTRYMPFF